jgi:hypothetical protein
VVRALRHRGDTSDDAQGLGKVECRGCRSAWCRSGRSEADGRHCL